LHPIFDAGWRNRALRGNADAIKLLAEAALPSLYAFCLYRVGRNHALCEDVVQETLVRAIHDLRQYEPARADNNIYPWLVGLAAMRSAAAWPGRRIASPWRLCGPHGQGFAYRLRPAELEPFGDDLLQREETRQDGQHQPCRSCRRATATPWKPSTSAARASATWLIPGVSPKRRPSRC